MNRLHIKYSRFNDVLRHLAWLASYDRGMAFYFGFADIWLSEISL